MGLKVHVNGWIVQIGNLRAIDGRTEPGMLARVPRLCCRTVAGIQFLIPAYEPAKWARYLVVSLKSELASRGKRVISRTKVLLRSQIVSSRS
jgi:hypothetical protein